MKNEATIISSELPTGSAISMIDHLVSEGARRMLQSAIEAEVDEYIRRHRDLRDQSGRQAIVRNGTLPERELATTAGMIPITQPRVRDRRGDDERLRFTSAILPRYARKSPTLEVLLPVLYLKGISTGDFSNAFEALLGPKAPGLSAATITRLVEQWQQDHQQWSSRDLSGRQFVYIWVDGIYTNVRLTDERPCVLVMIGATADGRKELLAVVDGERESTESWKQILLDIKGRGLTTAPVLAVADGALGFWKALEEVYPSTRHQLCWVHKTANVLNALPKKLQLAAKEKLQQIYGAPTRADALEQFSQFAQIYRAKYPKAVATVERHLEQLLTFYDVPAEHWQHIRTTNVIESAFASVRHRQRQTKGNGSRKAALAMIYKLGIEAEKTWRTLTAPHLLRQLLAGETFVDGVALKTEVQQDRVAEQREQSETMVTT
jgi:transposase-like protein